ncbi:MgtC/SapB family protein [Niabella drilacis]|uniref:Putative Mg2+ transporter-C (MgtC) family protein n=1 Tax=Niabella drilacis (strain DSM 25811 / CCM 8410 / CCUG 62505 / LMG 26954 / E90) TaxID=1285928 RepID=A0A1G6JEP9_NIADE|nr:MgtC/SapB family protein [Niabella drilacis]SDC17228.1 putative Mg2+ transporter-C (MgtC) family protein [Niabella drilacis]
MTDIFEITDLYKALLALLAGVILGLERELKDKAAGLKTISVICLGSALFSVLSIKIMGPDADGARIASYVVSGIGFLGAGVIFKDGAGVSGLTTASVIWMAAAVGMSIGFGKIYVAAIFLAACLLIIYTGRYLNLALFSGKTSRVLKIVLLHNNTSVKDEIIRNLQPYISRFEQVKLESFPEKMIVSLNLMIPTKKLAQLEEYLVKEHRIESFEL